MQAVRQAGGHTERHAGRQEGRKGVRQEGCGEIYVVA